MWGPGEYFLAVWLAGVFIGFFVIGFVRSKAGNGDLESTKTTSEFLDRLRDFRSEVRDDKMSSPIIAVVVWPIIAGMALASAIIMGPFALVYWAGHLIGKRFSKAREDA